MNSFGSVRLLLISTMIAVVAIGVAVTFAMKRCGFKGLDRALVWVPVVALEGILGLLYPLLVP